LTAKKSNLYENIATDKKKRGLMFLNLVAFLVLFGTLKQQRVNAKTAIAVEGVNTFDCDPYTIGIFCYGFSRWSDLNSVKGLTRIDNITTVCLKAKRSLVLTSEL
jgi:hypothetical protein